MPNLFDARLYKAVGIMNNGENGFTNGNSRVIRPYSEDFTGDFSGDYYETPEAVYISAEERINELVANKDSNLDKKRKEIMDWADKRAKYIKDKTRELQNSHLYVGPYSMIQPYAVLKLSGGTGRENIGNLFDSADTRRWYEVDSNEYGYSKNPTTSTIIKWSEQDDRHRFPYAFTDFVFCKYWNKIQNNRMITLRRYPSPVSDNVEPGIYADNDSMSNSPDHASGADKLNSPFGPLATAVTFFGEGTDNKLSDILKFSIGYEWEEITSDVWKTSSSQPDEGNIINQNDTYLSGGLRSMAYTLGILGDLKGDSKINPRYAASNLPPDPYHDGPYENRILGPINVINKVYKRKPGLKFAQDGLKITFNYVSRPIANVNNKAIMLDLLANIMLMTSARGTFFGGLHRYRTENPAIYPWRNANVLNNLYKGKLFGKDGAIRQTLGTAFNSDNFTFAMNFGKDLFSGIMDMASDLINKITGKGKSRSDSKRDTTGKQAIQQGIDTASRAIAAKYMKGITIPYLTGAKAILTGDPIGDWHLTIGNPLNPIAMIGNLIVDSSDITFSDELGPDDFPIGFTAVITLKHGMGRDRDATESMFNRGNGRIYSLPSNFMSAADRQTVVDDATGDDAKKNVNAFVSGKNGYNDKVDVWTGIATSGFDYISKIGNTKLPTAGTAMGALNQYNLTINSANSLIDIPSYASTPWATHYIL